MSHLRFLMLKKILSLWRQSSLSAWYEWLKMMFHLSHLQLCWMKSLWSVVVNKIFPEIYPFFQEVTSLCNCKIVFQYKWGCVRKHLEVLWHFMHMDSWPITHVHIFLMVYYNGQWFVFSLVVWDQFPMLKKNWKVSKPSSLNHEVSIIKIFLLLITVVSPSPVPYFSPIFLFNLIFYWIDLGFIEWNLLRKLWEEKKKGNVFNSKQGLLQSRNKQKNKHTDEKRDIRSMENTGLIASQIISQFNLLILFWTFRYQLKFLSLHNKPKYTLYSETTYKFILDQFS